MSLKPTEIESIGLYIVVRAIDDFINRELLHFHEVGGVPTFKGSVARDLFAVRLLDFLEQVDPRMTGVKGSCVDLLETAVVTSSFDRDASVEGLRTTVQTLRTWLNERITVHLWLPSLELDTDLTLTRQNLLYVAGNTSKHNLSRLSGVAGRLQTILKENNHEIGREASWLAVDDFEEHFKEDLLAFYCVRITGLVNDVRWAIHDYLLPEFHDSYTRDPNHEVRYSYRYPEGVSSPFARDSYWALMNRIRARPYIERFVVPEYMMEHPFRVSVESTEATEGQARSIEDRTAATG